MPNRREPVVEILIYAALLRLLAARHTQYGILARFLRTAEATQGPVQAGFLRDLLDRRAGTKRFIRTFNLLGPHYLLREVLAAAAVEAPPLDHFEKLLLDARIDINVKREKLVTALTCLESRKAAWLPVTISCFDRKPSEITDAPGHIHGLVP